jgi:hypothetical protein
LDDARPDRDLGADADDRFAHRDAAVGVIGHGEAMGLGGAANARDVVGVVRGDGVLQQSAIRGLDDAQLIAAVGRGEHASAVLGKTELAVELLGCVHVGNAQRHLCQTVQPHCLTPSFDCLPFYRSDVRYVKKISILHDYREHA